MSKKVIKIDELQMALFSYREPETPPAEGSMNISIRLRKAASRACDKRGGDRIDICAAIYKLTGIEVPLSTLNGWTAESRDKSGDHIDHCGNKRWGMPAEIVPAFCQVTGDWEVLFILAEAGHFKALRGKEVVHARMGLLKEEIAKRAHELKDLEKQLMAEAS